MYGINMILFGLTFGLVMVPEVENADDCRYVTHLIVDCLKTAY